MTAARAIGIDLGTTNSCVGAFVNNDVVIFENYEGKPIQIYAFKCDRTTASYVAFTDCESIVGNAAKSRVVGDPNAIVHCAKRLIGRKSHDTSVQKDIKNFAFKVTKGADDRPSIEVQYKGEVHKFCPEAISGMVLRNLKETAERKLNVTVSDAVITVPAYFTDAQRQATIDAARIAGLNVLRLINEPTAAALAYGIGHAGDKPRTVLIYDLGGGTFDVSIVRVAGQDYDVLDTAGDTHLGGEDFDDLLVEHFAKVLNEKYDCDTFNKPKARRRLRLKCEEAKRALSSNVQALIEVDLFEDDYCCTVNRAQFEGLCGALIRGTLSDVEKCLKEAGLSKADIDHVLLVGGSTRIPLVQKVLSEFFGGKPLNLSLNPDEAVAYGAALLAAKLTDVDADALRDVKLSDVTALSLGVGTLEKRVTRFIERNSKIPCKAVRVFQTGRDNETVSVFPVYEGEREMCKDNRLLGEFRVSGIPPAPRGVQKFDVTLEMDANGILHAFAINTSTGRENGMTIEMDKGLLAKEEIQRLVKEAEKYKAEDEAHRERISAMNQLESFCIELSKKLGDLKIRCKTTENERKKLRGMCGDNLRWVSDNRFAEKEAYQQRQKEVETAWKPLEDSLRE